MKFLADMGISRKTVAHLRDQGHDASHLLELGLHRMRDSDVLDLAASESRVVLTVDLDFPQLLAMRRASAPSVVLFRLADKRAVRIIARLEEVLRMCGTDLERGAVVSVDETTIRVHALPFASD